MPAQVPNEYDLECLLARDSLPILPVSELWQLAQIALKNGYCADSISRNAKTTRLLSSKVKTRYAKGNYFPR